MYKNQEADSPAELECQFILRLPVEPARVLHEAIRSGSTLKDRLAIKIENDMRHGEVRVDNWILPGKVMDLPTINESLKTIDGKGFYKTADICQILLCKEEDDQVTTDEDSPQKSKRKDPNKVEKKYLMPHGITPPTKNVRKRRFRKTLKKKYVEAPEIEKEVKRLLRIDNDAVSVKWEVINEDDENKVNKGTVVKKEPVDAPTTSSIGHHQQQQQQQQLQQQQHTTSSSLSTPITTNQNVAEHDIFGGAVSDSDEEDAHLNVIELDDNSQNSADDSHLTDSNSMMLNSNGNKLLTEFTSDMFRDTSPSIMQQDIDYYQQQHQHQSQQQQQQQNSYPEHNLTRTNIEQRLEQLQIELADLKMRRQQQETEIENIENIALRQRFQDILDRLLQEQIEKEQEKYGLEELLKQSRD